MLPKNEYEQTPNPTSETRKESFLKSKRKSKQRQEQVEQFIRSRGPLGATRDEIALFCRFPPHSCPSVVQKLIEAGLVYNSSEKRLTTNGCPAVVVKATAGKAKQLELPGLLDDDGNSVFEAGETK